MARDDFRKETKKILQERAGNHCSNPTCRCLTSGPNYDKDKATRIGVAAHITAASPGGPRYDPALNEQERRSIQNGIWLCQNCSTLVDSDPSKYDTSILFRWKTKAEDTARRQLEGESAESGEEISGYECPYCDTFVKEGAIVCTGCGAEVVYGSSEEERKGDLQMGAILTGVLLFFGMSSLPDAINYFLETAIAPFFGVHIGAMLVLIALFSILSGLFWSEKAHRKRSGNEPRFFRQMHI